MTITTPAYVVFIVLALFGSYYTFLERSLSYAKKKGFDPVLAIPDGMRRSPKLFAIIPIIVWCLRIVLFLVVIADNPAIFAFGTVLASWIAQLCVYRLYPHRVENFKD